MAEQFDGKVEIVATGGLDDPTKLRITLDGDTANMEAGGYGKSGTLVLKTPGGDVAIVLQTQLNLAEINAGGQGRNGSLRLRPASAGTTLADFVKSTVSLWAESATIAIGNHGENGQLWLRGSNGEDRIRLEASNATARLGGAGANGRATFFREEEADPDHDTKATIYVNGDRGNIRLGGNDVHGRMAFFRKEKTGKDLYDYKGQATIDLNGANATARLGGAGANGRATFFRKEEADPDHDTKATIYVNGDRGNIRLGGNGVHGRMAFFRSEKSGNDLYDYNGQATIQLQGSTGDIILKNADCAEDFDIIDVEEVEPGTVVVIDDDGQLRACDTAYDTRVAGIISGAGAYKSGIVLDRQPERKDRRPLALMGKAECLVDATAAPIEVGSLLTTSPLRGHAMRAVDPLRAFGAVIGKALRPLTSGKGSIPVLIALQ